MGYNIINAKQRGKCSEGLKCTFYKARQPSVQNNEGATQLSDTLKQINPSLGFCTVCSQKPPTVLTELSVKGYVVPSGSVLSYQLSLTEGNFIVITNFPALQRPRNSMSPFLTFPLLVMYQLWDYKCLLLMKRISLLIN